VSTYFDHVSKATSWEVLDLPPAIEVTESKLTDEEIREWTRKLNDLSAARFAASLPE
jgi:hypothetical protein